MSGTNSNTSATGGPLVPIPGGPAPLEGQGLNRFLVPWIAGITGLPGNYVRPAWQSFPANPPITGATCWCAVAVPQRPILGFPQKTYDPVNNNVILKQWEQLLVLTSFYDDGVNGQADFYCSVLRDGLFIDQNNELLFVNGIGLIGVGSILAVPTLINERWYYRADLEITLERLIQRTYPVENLLSATGSLIDVEVNYNEVLTPSS